MYFDFNLSPWAFKASRCMIACSSLSFTLSHPFQDNNDASKPFPLTPGLLHKIKVLKLNVTIASLILRSWLELIDEEDSDPVVSDICISFDNLFFLKCGFISRA